jgi:hypothetical protein
MDERMKENNRTFIIIFSYIILSSTVLITIDLAYQSNNNNNKAYAANQINNNLSNSIGATTDNKSLIKPANNTNSTSVSLALNEKMAELVSSNKPQDIATLAYIWGYPLVTMERSSNYFTSPNSPPVVGQGPANTISFARQIVNASFTNVVSPNADTLYGISWLDLKKEPLVLTVPPITQILYI